MKETDRVRIPARLSIAMSPACQVLGSSRPSTPLEQAAQEADLQLTRSLLAQGQEAHLRDSTLHVAGKIGHKEIVELLLSYGADVNAVRWGNLTLLIFAVTAGCDFNILSSFTNPPFSPASAQSMAASDIPTEKCP